MRLFPVSAVCLCSMLAALALRATPAESADTCGDVNGTGTVTASDALAVLQKSVGQNVNLQCPLSGELLRTGQSMCWNSAGTEVPCHGTGQDGELRIGQPLDYTDNGDGTITDHVTGLMWENLSRNGTIHEVSNTYDWSGAFVKIGALNDESFAGHTDWRVPNQRELESLVTFGGSAAQTIAAVFRTDCHAGCAVTTCSCTAAEDYWSSTTDPFAFGNALGVNFGTTQTFSAAKSLERRARAVRSAS